MEGYSYMLLRSIAALGLVAALIAGAVYGLRLLSGRRGSALGQAPISVISKVFMGQKSSIAIVDVAGEVLVLGVSPNAINLLLHIKDPEAIQILKDSPARGGLRGLGRLIKRGPVNGIKMEKGR